MSGTAAWTLGEAEVLGGRRFETWRSWSQIERDCEVMGDGRESTEARAAADARTSPMERQALVDAVDMLVLAEHVGAPRGPLQVADRLRAIPALSPPFAVVLAALEEHAGPMSEADVWARFGRRPDESLVSRDTVCVALGAALVELVRRRLVVRVSGRYQAATQRQMGRAA